MTRYSKRAITVFWAFLLALGISDLLAPLGLAQAFLPYKGEGNYYFGFQNFYTRDHFGPDGTRFPAGEIQENALMQGVEYGVTTKLALDVSFPYVFAKYDGPFPHQSPGNMIDNGDYHGTFSDFRFGARYNLEMRPLVITPFVEGIIPSHDYQIFAHAAVGYGLRELRLGVNVGRYFPSWRSAIQAGYSYGIVQEHLGIRPNRSTLRSQFQYFVSSRLFVTGLQSFQKSHGGIDVFPDNPNFYTWENESWYRHAQIGNFSFLNFGVSAGYALNRSGSVEITGNYITDVWGQNGHALNRGVGISLIFNFRTRYYDERGTQFDRNNCGVVCRKCQTIFRLPTKRTPTPGR